MYTMYVNRHAKRFIKNAAQVRRPSTIVDFQNEIIEKYVRPEGEEEGAERGRRFIRWSIRRRLGANRTSQIVTNLRQNVDRSFYIRYSYSYVLVNRENGLRMVFFHQQKGSPWMNNLGEAEGWVNQRENERLNVDNIKRPNTKWAFVKFSSIEVKAVIDNQPLLGTGPLPDWLRGLAHGPYMVSLDTFGDNLCLWRCIAVYQGSRSDRCTRVAKLLARGFFKSALVPRTSLDELDKVEGHLNEGKHLSQWIGIRVYEPERQQNGEIDWYLRKTPSDKLKNIITIGIHEGHAFLIKDIEKLAKMFVCSNCRGRFTKPCHLQRHIKTCAQGKTTVDCPNEKVKAPLTNYERTFYSEGNASQLAISWLEKTSKQLGIHIHHAMCGHGGERYILGAPVDGYAPKPETIFQYHGCWWHGCRRCFPDRNTIINHGKTREEVYIDTLRKTQRLREAGYRVIEKWECEDMKTKERNPQKQTKSYPHFIFYDFESYQDKTKRKEATKDLTYENTHVPISVSIGDTLEREPTFICDPDAKSLIKKFMEELERRGKNIREAVSKDYMPEDMHVLPRKKRGTIKDWCDQVPVLGFNCGRYDLNLIKEHFAELLADTTARVQIAKKANTTMFMKTDHFLFLDIINYLGPGTSYDAWVKAYGCSVQKSWLPYEWFDTPAKLHYPGLPDYPAWYSKLKDSFVLKLSEFRECRKVFKEKGMATFGDWLRYYNNLDVAPGLEALEKMRAFYSERGIDILKDAVSLPGVSLHYLLRGTVERGAEMYSPWKEAYDMLKNAMVGGPSIVFNRYHEAGVTQIRPHRFTKTKTCQRIIGYDANALYPSTMLREMPCGKEKVQHFEDPRAAAANLVYALKNKAWFGFAEVDIEIPQGLWMKFEEMPPFFFTAQIPRKAVPQHMKDYMARTGRKRGEGKKLVGALSAQKLLLYEPLLQWYVSHGAQITAVYRTINYQATKALKWFVDEVTAARRTGDADKSKALLADIFKLLGNSSYGKMIECLERQTRVMYTKDEKVVDRALRSAFFEDLDEIGQAYELESRKPRILINRPFQIGIAVYQLAKLRMLEFYYDFLDRYVDRRDFELVQMDTDSNYMAISGDKLEDIIRPELRAEFEATKKNWLAWDKWSGRTPGLFKLESEGSAMIALCSKCYFVNGEKKKFSTKGMSKKQNEITWQRFKAALNGDVDRAQNRGFRMVGNQMVTYEQKKLGLSAYYDKRWVLPDGIHTEPIEFHMA